MAQASDSEPARAGAPRYSRKQAPERKRLLIEASVACLAEGGIAGFTVERICKKAGISKGLISHHFAGKEDLLAQTYEAKGDAALASSTAERGLLYCQGRAECDALRAYVR